MAANEYSRPESVYHQRPVSDDSITAHSTPDASEFLRVDWLGYQESDAHGTRRKSNNDIQDSILLNRVGRYQKHKAGQDGQSTE
jgi:hypothetical protein